MFGTYRIILALCVVFQHIGGFPRLGGYAVFGFYILSGYLMTMVMNKSYGYSLVGLKKFSINRFLRIFPGYWASIIFSMSVLYVYGEDAVVEYKNAIYWPQSIIDWLQNIFIFFPQRQLPILTPPAWALTVELFFYFLIGLSLSRMKIVSLLWLGLGILYHAVALILDWGWPNRYFTVAAASLPFAIGACIYHYPDILGKFLKNWKFEKTFGVLIFLLAINWFAGYTLRMSQSWFFYLNILICTISVALLAQVKLEDSRWQRLDQFFGALSYPVYLIHYQVAAVVVFTANENSAINIARPSLLLLLLALPFILLVGWLMAALVDRPVDLVRNKVRRMAVV